MSARPKLLLHICCAPDATSVFELLKDRFEVIGFFYNPQIEPREEYERRLAETKRVAEEMEFELIAGEYDLDLWQDATRGLEGEPEKGRRCEVCYLFRLEETAKVASEKGFDYFTSTLSVSPHKSFDWLQGMGQALSAKYGVKFLAEDFKKEEGFKRSLEWSEKLHLYRQDYCGCLPSLENRKRILQEQEESYQLFADELRACKLCEDFLDPAVIFEGGANQPLMIIGQAPGRHELASLRPFSGPAGRKLWSWFADLGYEEDLIRSNAYVTAVAKCYPGLAPNGKDDAPPSSPQRKNCIPWLEAEFANARPKLLVLIGSLAAKTVLGKDAGMNLVGERIERRIWNRKVSVIVLPHPSGLNRWPNMPGNRPRFERALALLGEELKRYL
ncbi:MAG: epoxyqueuosine reductase QueH [candidate division WOR-3 bacterium]|nr:epoxyqueuosine reductase QueH [candidate division WOR-3 bacterium]